MAITPTPAHYEGFVYGAVDSHTYGVVISDTNAYDSAGRAVEMITIPGRNGAYAMDHKRYENIEVTYHCSIPATDPADFISAISDLRNALGALTGYNRLTDDFNGNEYRMAVLKGGVGVTNINPQAGTFDVVFDCKPQRFLTSGEAPVSLQSGDTITNPTLYESKPLLHVTGYGDFGINGVKDMSVQSPGYMGWVRVAERVPTPSPDLVQYSPLDTTQYNVGDKIDMAMNGEQIIGSMSYMPNDEDDIQNIQFELVSYSSSAQTPYLPANGLSFGGTYPFFTTGTSRTRNNTITTKVSYTLNGTATSENFTSSLGIVYDGNVSISITLTPGVPSHFTLNGSTITSPQVLYVKSTKPAPNDAYIDLDIGQAYRVSNGVVQSVNDQVYLPAQLPSLVPGTNTITFDNTITALSVTPRWWQL